MQLSGSEILNADSLTVWEMLMDPVVLERVVPGITKLERLSDNTFKSILQIKIGPVSGSFIGNLQLEDITTQKSFTLKAQQNSRIGNANAAIKINVVSVEPARTEVNFEGEVKITGMLATMGQRVIGGVANTLTKQFFSNLQKELQVKETPS
jgi:carbon monoxide dehydrogenase subunit G